LNYASVLDATVSLRTSMTQLLLLMILSVT